MTAGQISREYSSRLRRPMCGSGCSPSGGDWSFYTGYAPADWRSKNYRS